MHGFSSLFAGVGCLLVAFVLAAVKLLWITCHHVAKACHRWLVLQVWGCMVHLYLCGKGCKWTDSNGTLTALK
jgi:hypothetical protein